MTRREPIWAAYNGARISESCPNCGAPPHVWCTRPDGRVRRTPCLARTTPATEPVGTSWVATADDNDERADDQ